MTIGNYPAAWRRWASIVSLALGAAVGAITVKKNVHFGVAAL
jgi:hypothetical protein